MLGLIAPWQRFGLIHPLGNDLPSNKGVLGGELKKLSKGTIKCAANRTKASFVCASILTLRTGDACAALGFGTTPLIFGVTDRKKCLAFIEEAIK